MLKFQVHCQPKVEMKPDGWKTQNSCAMLGLVHTAASSTFACQNIFSKPYRIVKIIILKKHLDYSLTITRYAILVAALRVSSNYLMLYQLIHIHKNFHITPLNAE